MLAIFQALHPIYFVFGYTAPYVAEHSNAFLTFYLLDKHLLDNDSLIGEAARLCPLFMSCSPPEKRTQPERAGRQS